jgi:hypothetical protein
VSCRQGSNYVQVETLFHEGIHNCSGVTYATIIRHPIERLFSHLIYNQVSARKVKDLLTGREQSKDYVHNVWERRHLPACIVLSTMFLRETSCF